jgi:YjbE family integral membrane protein
MSDSDLFSQLTAFVSVVLIDVVLAGDNAVVVGTAAAGLPPKQQRHVIVVGSALALVARVAFALVATRLLAIIGLTLAGGLLLLWVAWKIWRELRRGQDTPEGDGSGGKTKSFGAAVVQVAVADISMSLDNVLAVAGVAREHTWVLVVGLVLSVAFMGAAASVIARLLHRLYWLSYVGLGIILFVACHMIFDGTADVWGIASSNW